MIPLNEAVTSWVDAGFSLIPIRNDGTKRPIFEWKRFMSQRMNAAQVQWYLDGNPGAGIGIVCGAVSGNLEMLELEGRAADPGSLLKIISCLDAAGARQTWDIINLGLVVQSPSGGVHFFYRISDHEVPGNEKVARRPPTDEELAAKPKDKVKVLAETRGEGGFVVAAPSGGTVHPSGKSWEIVVGSPAEVPTITWAEREALHLAIYAALDEMPEQQSVHEVPDRPRTEYTGDQSRPGDDFNERADWRDSLLLGGAGWTIHHVRGGTTYWVKPGSDPRDGHHATTGKDGVGAKDRLYVFSTATEFPTEEPLSKFAVYAQLHHGGDFKAATKALAAQHYGEPLEQKKATEPLTEFTPNVALGESVRSEVAAGHPFLPTPRGVTDYTTSGAVARFCDEWGKYVHFVTEEKFWRIWNGVTWAKDESGALVMQAFEAMTETMRDECRAMENDEAQADMAKAYKKHIQKLRDSSRASILILIAARTSITADQFDANPRYFNLRNGVYDMAADKFLPHDPKYLLTKVAGFAYDPEATASDTESFLEGVLPDAELREFTLQALGYSLTGEADRKAFFVLQGLSNSGKTQLLELCQDVWADYAVSVSPGTFAKRQNPGAPVPELHDMRGARLIYTSETSHDLQLDEETVKRFTGKDTMTTRTLYQRPQRWVPQGTVWVATNNLPRFSQDEEAMWRRVKTIRFVNVFTDDGSSGHLAVANIGRNLAAKEGSGIFNLLLAALRRYRAAGRLLEPTVLVESVTAHREETDVLARHLADLKQSGELSKDDEWESNQGQIYGSYKEACEQEGIRPLGPQRFGMALRQHLNHESKRSNNVTWVIGWRYSGREWISLGPKARRRE